MDSSNPYAASPSDSHSSNRALAEQRVKIPAMFLLLTGIASIFGAVLYALYPTFYPPLLEQMASDPNTPQQTRDMIQMQLQQMKAMSWMYYAFAVLSLIGAVFMCIGAIKMKNLKGYGLALTGNILALIPFVSPCCTCVFPLVAGIWGIIVLVNSDVRSEFS